MVIYRYENESFDNILEGGKYFKWKCRRLGKWNIKIL